MAIPKHFDVMKKYLYLLIIFLAGWYGSQAQSLVFVENRGQWEGDFLYRTYGLNSELFLEPSGFTVLVGHPDNLEKIHEVKEGRLEGPQTMYFHAYRARWVDAQSHPVVRGDKPETYYMNFFLGNDQSKWKSGINPVRAIDMEEIYPGINVRLSSSYGKPKFDYVLAPGADPNLIRIRYTGLDKIEIKNGKLVLHTSVGTIEEMQPYSYQEINGARVEVPCEYKLLDEQTVAFNLTTRYDKRAPLVIDPVIDFASLTGSIPDNWGFTATYDNAGNLYGGGIVNGMSYPVSEGAFQITFAGGAGTTMPCDVGISKFSSDGSTLLYSTYIGGSGNDYPHSMIVDPSGNLYISGKTNSTNFPTVAGSYDVSHNGGFDIFILTLNATGTDLLASTYIGGSGDDGLNVDDAFTGNTATLKYNYGDNSRSEILIDGSNNVYVAAATRSTNFPVTASAVKSTLSGTQDGVIFKLNSSLSSLLWSTYLGGSNDDAAYVIAFSNDKSVIYVAGGTQSSDFMSTYMSGYWSSYQGGTADGFICKFQNSGSYPLLGATFIGTGAYDQVYGIQVDKDNDVYVMGQTLGSFPVTEGVYSVPNSRQFLMKLNPDLDENIYSTVWGQGATTQPNIVPVAFLVDTCENVYISGWGGPTIAGGSMSSLPITEDALQPTTDGNDFYFIVFHQDASELIYASYFGANGKAEHVDGGTSRFDPNGKVYQAICASCGPGSSAFPATSGAWASTKGSVTTNCNLGVVKISFNMGSVTADFEIEPTDHGCAPLTVNFNNLSVNASEFQWSFGDGSTSIEENPSHMYTTPGEYQVRLIASNLYGCKNKDTAYATVYVIDNEINAQFTYETSDSCNNLSVAFTNTSTSYSGIPFATSTFVWHFGDGTTYEGPFPPEKHYSEPGTYTVTLIMYDSNSCHSPDSVQAVISFETFDVEANFTGGEYCLDHAQVNFDNTSVNGVTYMWNFGDGASSTEATPTHTFPGPGTYQVTLYAYNPATCNQVDSITHTITIYPNPNAGFVFSPMIPETNKPTRFTNTSSGATSYKWDFGDGTTSTEQHPEKQYDKSGRFKVCLTAINEYGCEDSVCKFVEASVIPLLDIPTAFTPNGDGNNDILFPRGFSVATMRLEIYNRWGELVFESESMDKGWDGTYKGVEQPMDSYSFILTATFLDGSTYQKKGNITLIR